MEWNAEVAAIVARLPELDAAVIGRIERERDEYRKLYLLAREEIAQLKRGLLGQKAQRVPVNDGRLSLAILDLLLGTSAEATEPAPTQTIAPHERRKPVRRPLPAIVKRWQDHLPLHRMESIYRREGFEFNRSTICGWHMQLAALVRPLIEAMHAEGTRIGSHRLPLHIQAAHG